MKSDFDRLQPDLILSALESAGYFPTGQYTQLNSYENRVFDMRLEIQGHAPHPVDRVIAKFYRPRRWSAKAIADEHEFLNDLQREGIPAVAPLPLNDGSTLKEYEGYVFSVFPRVVGRNPQEFLKGELHQVGRTLARIHNVGSRKRAQHRLNLDAQSYGWNSLKRLEKFVYPELWRAYQEASEAIIDYLDQELEPAQFIRIHGDCHKGNLLHTGSEFFFVDFDDFCNGPVIQDFWMLLSGTGADVETEIEHEQICEGYSELRSIPDEWHLFEPLRGLRVIHYAGWIAQRWEDPFFKQIFPDFEGYNYWRQELLVLEKIASNL